MIHAMWTVTEDRLALRVRPEVKRGAKSVDWGKTKPVEINELLEIRRNLESAYAVLEEERQSWKFRDR